MAGEGGKALLDALLIADIGVDFIEDSQLRAVRGGNLQPRLRHEGEQAHCFQGDGFAAGVGAGDHQGSEILAQPQVAGNDLVRIDQRMPGADEVDAALLVELGRHGVHAATQGGAGEDHVDFRQIFQGVADHFGVGADLTGERGQYALDFRLLLQIPLLELVARFHHGHGLDEQRGARAALIVHNAGHAAAAFRLHRHHVAAVAHGDDGIHQILGHGG